MPENVLRKIVPSILFALVITAQLFPVRSRAETAFFPPRSPIPAAVIRSCVSQVEEEKSRYRTSPSFSPAKSAGAGAPAGAIFPPMPSTLSQAAPMPLMEARSFDSAKPEEGMLDVNMAGKKVDKEIRRASELYLSNDDSMSLASAQRLIYAINNFLPVYRSEIRPHELLNYFHFKTNPVAEGSTFSVKAQSAGQEKGETLALAVQGKILTLTQRRPAVLTLIVDKSGSMAAEGKMDYLKEGLALVKSQLKAGDVVNVVEFDHETCNAMEGFVVGRDDWRSYDKTVDELGPRGSTDLHAGLVEGYKLAERFHDPSKINRVILITDAIANTGELSSDLMASIGKYYDTKQIALSGIGVGLDFNDELLNSLTDKGKGAYLFLGMREALPRVFGSDFVSLLDTIARDVHFKAVFPKGLHLDVFYGEEVSTDKAKVQPIHYFANTSQLFLLDLLGKAEGEDAFKLQIEYNDPISGQLRTEEFPASLAQLKNAGQENVAKARLLMAMAQLIEKTSLPGDRPYSGWRLRIEPSTRAREEGKKQCALASEEMKKKSAIYADTETNFAQDLVAKYCSRF